jgi:hypothetical protein
MGSLHKGARRGRDERGNMAALEGVFIGMLMVSSIAILASLAPDKPSIPPARAAIENIAEDALQGLQGIPTNDRYVNELNKIIAKAYVGNSSDLQSYTERSLPPGAGWRLWLDNGHSRKLLAGMNETGAPRQSVSATRLWHPDWNYAVVVPTFDIVPPSMALQMQEYDVAQGALVKEAGIPVVVDVQTDQGNYTASVVTSLRPAPALTLWMQNVTGGNDTVWVDPAVPPTTNSTVYSATRSGLPASGTFSVPAGVSSLSVQTSTTFALGAGTYTLTLTPPSGAPSVFVIPQGSATNSVLLPTSGTWSVSAAAIGAAPSSSTVTVVATTTNYNKDWSFVVKETAGQAAPAGTNLTLTFPSAFTVSFTNTTQTGWANYSVVPSADGGWIAKADMTQNLSNGWRALSVHADRGASNTEALYLVRGELGNGTSGTGTFVIPGINALTTSDGNPVQHRIYTSAPKPMSPGALAEWAITLVYPSTVSNLLGSETIQSVDVHTLNGENIFAYPLPRENTTGWTWWAGNWLHWQGAAKALQNGATNLTLTVQAGATNATNDEPAIHPPLTFDNGFTSKFYDARQPYVSINTFPPAASGSSNGFINNVLDQPLNASTTLYTRSSLVTGSGQYTVSNIPSLTTAAESLRVGMSRSFLNVSTHTVRVGQTVNVTADFRPLFSQISPLLTNWSLDVSVYDPTQPFEQRSAWAPRSSASASPATWPPSAANAWIAMNFTPGDDSFYGPHLVVSQAHFTLAGMQVADTARMLQVVDVVPDGGQAETALYWVILEAWMPDWG